MLKDLPNLSPSATANASSSEFHNYAPWVNVVLGLLVFILRYSSPRGTFAVHWNLFLTGLVVMFAALAATIAHDEHASKNYWSAVNLCAGIWLLVSVKTVPSVLRVTVAQTGLGALIAAIALVSLSIEMYKSRAMRRRSVNSRR